MHRVAFAAQHVGGGGARRDRPPMMPIDNPVSRPTWIGLTQPLAKAVSVMYFSTAPMVTD